MGEFGKSLKKLVSKKELQRTMEECYLVGAGEFQKDFFSYKEREFLIAVDGGYTYLKELGIKPHIAIGDFDSLKEMGMSEKEIEKEGLTVKRLPCEKDETDVFSALSYGLELGKREFHIYGGLGGRLDHSMANIQCLNYLKSQDAFGYLYGIKTILTVVEEESLSFRREAKGFFSLFAMDEKVQGITLEGVKYPLSNAVLTNEYPLGVSNEFIGERAVITVGKGRALLIFPYMEGGFWIRRKDG